MLRVSAFRSFFPSGGSFNEIRRGLAGIKPFHVKEEVRLALATGQPVVALESTIITHGMPYPDNIECAKQVEDNVRKQVRTISHLSPILRADLIIFFTT